MYRYSNGQISLSDFQQPMGMRLREDNPFFVRDCLKGRKMSDVSRNLPEGAIPCRVRPAILV